LSIRAHVVALVGGVGGAKLALGLSRVLPPEALTIIVNTGDDFEHLGLHISPDVDTVMYTLADLANPETGWGVRGDTFQAMEMVSRYGGADWFRLGDRDLSTNLLRTQWLRDGLTLTEVTRRLSRALGITCDLLPMSDDPVCTVLETNQGTLAFQEYFVREHWQPMVREIRFEGSEVAKPSNAVIRALEAATLIAIAPSNPFLSIDPILSISGIRERIEKSRAPRLAVSPVIGGQAVKGPTVKLMAELGVDNSPLGVADHYQNLIDGIILDVADSDLCSRIDERCGIRATALQTYMVSTADKIELAGALLEWVEESNT
jgi:LPPG:FO 2-phospho-L-lactate transferase